MPKDTFYNLPATKRQRIIKAGLDEFSRHNYAAAAVSRIAAQANIAKGSFYQYFADKRDFYLYLLDLAADVKLAYITRSLDRKETDFFTLYKRMLLTGARFDLEQTVYSRLLHNAGQEKRNTEIGDTAGRLMAMSENHLRRFLTQARAAGQIQRDVACDLQDYLVSRVSVLLGSYLMHKYRFSLPAVIRDSPGRLPLTKTELEKTVDSLIAFLRSGLGQTGRDG